MIVIEKQLLKVGRQLSRTIVTRDGGQRCPMAVVKNDDRSLVIMVTLGWPTTIAVNTIVEN